VDFETQSVCGPDADAFANNLKRRFTYAFLSAYAFDIHTGDVYSHAAREVALQRAVANRFAATKFLFLDSSKFKSEGDGENGYTVSELLETSHTVTIYAVSVDDERDRWVLDGFDKLGRVVFGDLCRYNVVSDGDLRDASRRLGHTGGHTSPSLAFGGGEKSQNP
jgi:hypothetical protein